jgi:hypothetical protein
MNDIVAGLIGHALTTLGGVLVGAGYFTSDEWTTIARSIGCLRRGGMVCDIQACNRSQKFSTLMIRPPTMKTPIVLALSAIRAFVDRSP